MAADGDRIVLLSRGSQRGGSNEPAQPAEGAARRSAWSSDRWEVGGSEVPKHGEQFLPSNTSSLITWRVLIARNPKAGKRLEPAVDDCAP
jgi:hypothetical protein